MFTLRDSQKIGVILIGFSVFFFFMGVLLFFDRGLLSVGNLVLLPGISLLLGVQRTKNFCLQKSKVKGLLCFLLGVFLVVMGWAFFGFILEAFGFLNLFGDFFPVVFAFVKSFMPISNQ